MQSKWNFNPRSPDGEQREAGVQAAVLPFISIHAPRMGSDLLFAGFHCCSLISIHAPRMGSDISIMAITRCIRISIHAPRMGSDSRPHAAPCTPRNFNPRSPDGERPFSGPHYDDHAGISIHAPRMGSDCMRKFTFWQMQISIHAPRMGSDRPSSRVTLRTSIFQSTLPGWGATKVIAFGGIPFLDFNPRSPDGERQPLTETSPARLLISIHAPRMGSDFHDAIGVAL